MKVRITRVIHFYVRDYVRCRADGRRTAEGVEPAEWDRFEITIDKIGYGEYIYAGRLLFLGFSVRKDKIRIMPAKRMYQE